MSWHELGNGLLLLLASIAILAPIVPWIWSDRNQIHRHLTQGGPHPGLTGNQVDFHDQLSDHERLNDHLETLPCPYWQSDLT